jgi:hypothetical protein
MPIILLGLKWWWGEGRPPVWDDKAIHLHHRTSMSRRIRLSIVGAMDVPSRFPLHHHITIVYTKRMEKTRLEDDDHCSCLISGGPRRWLTNVINREPSVASWTRIHNLPSHIGRTSRSRSAYINESCNFVFSTERSIKVHVSCVQFVYLYGTPAYSFSFWPIER